MKPPWRAQHNVPYVALIGAVEESDDTETTPVYTGFDGTYSHYPIHAKPVVLLLSVGIDLSVLTKHLADTGVSPEQWLNDMTRVGAVVILGGGIQVDQSALKGIGIVFTGEVSPRTTGVLEAQVVVGVDGEVNLSTNLVRLLVAAGTDSIDSLIQRVCREFVLNEDELFAEFIQSLPELLYCGAARLLHQASGNS